MSIQCWTFIGTHFYRGAIINGADPASGKKTIRTERTQNAVTVTHFIALLYTVIERHPVFIPSWMGKKKSLLQDVGPRTEQRGRLTSMGANTTTHAITSLVSFARSNRSLKAKPRRAPP